MHEHATFTHAMQYVFKSMSRKRSQSLSLPGPSGPSSSSSTRSLLICSVSSAFCKSFRKSAFRGSTRSIGFSFALFRILFKPDSCQSTRTSNSPAKHPPTTHLGSQPASTKISTTAFPCSQSVLSRLLAYRTALCRHVSPSLRSCPSISTPSWSRIMSSTS